MTCIRPRFAVLVVGIALAACGSGDPPVDPATAVSKVTISASDTTLVVGGTLQFTAEASNAAGTILERTINWVSIRPNVATIGSLGLATGVETGTTVITATSGGRSGSVALTVHPGPVTPIPSTL